MSKASKLSLLFFGLALSAVLPGCKSKEETPAPAAPVAISGELMIKKASGSVSLPNFLDTSWKAIASFYIYPRLDTLIPAGIVRANGDTLIHPYANSYRAPYGWKVDPSATTHWDVEGENDIPSFSCDDPGPHPNYSGEIPLTVDRKAGVSISITNWNTSNADSVSLFFGQYNNSISKTVSARAGEVRLTPEDFATLKPTLEYPVLSLRVSRSFVKTFGEKNFRFLRARDYVYSVTVIN